MKRKLLNQMGTEWRANIWMVIELAIVGLIVAVIFWILVQLAYAKSLRTGYDIEDICFADCRNIPKGSDEYIDYGEEHDDMEDLNIILRYIRENPYAELAGLGTNCLPYSYNYYGSGVMLMEHDTAYSYLGNERSLTPEVIKILRLTGPKGETTEHLADVIEHHDYILSTYTREIANQNDPQTTAGSSNKNDPYKFANKDVLNMLDTTHVEHVGAVSYGIWRDDYEGCNGCIIHNLENSRGTIEPEDLIVRVKPGMTNKFIESLDSKRLQQGNVYISNMRSLQSRREECQRNIAITQRNITICAVFLLVAVFLGFLGTFWFRTQQRVPEIALRKVNGATPRQIFSRLISEGLILLVFGVIIYTPIYYYLLTTDIAAEIRAELISDSNLPNIVAYILSVLVLAVMIVAGIFFPARRAMKVQPADALKDQ
jgi:putative ABC transport system permease protein